MPPVQMNIRMDSALKASGNAAIAKLGYTPSQVVRALWEFVSVQDALPGSLARILQGAPSSNAAHNQNELDRASEGAGIISSFYEQVGIEEPSEGALDYDELRELAAAEQLEKWGFAR